MYYMNNFKVFTIETRALEQEELELALKSDARLDAELVWEEGLLADLEELTLLSLLLLLLLRNEELEEDLELRLD